MAIALQRQFPVPNRTDQSINHTKDEFGVIDIGWTEGLMSDGRPFRMEMWASDGVSMLTVFFSASGILEIDDKQIEDLILSEGFVTFKEGAEHHIEKMLRDDPAGNTMWSASIVVGDEDQTFVANSLPIFPNPSSDKPSSIFSSNLYLPVSAFGGPGQIPHPLFFGCRGPADPAPAVLREIAFCVSASARPAPVRTPPISEGLPVPKRALGTSRFKTKTAIGALRPISHEQRDIHYPRTSLASCAR